MGRGQGITRRDKARLWTPIHGGDRREEGGGGRPPFKADALQPLEESEGRLRHNVIDMMTEPAQLSDEDLLDRAHQLRLLALRGHADSRGPAHEHEREVRRRFGSGTTIGAPLEHPVNRRPFWKFW